MKKFIILIFCFGCYSTDRKLETYDYPYAMGYRKVSTVSSGCPDKKYAQLECLPVQTQRCPFDIRPDCKIEW